MSDVFGGMRLRRTTVKGPWWRSLSRDQRREFEDWAWSLGWLGGGFVTWHDDGFTLTRADGMIFGESARSLLLVSESCRGCSP